MSIQIRKKAKAIAWLLSLVYFASYLTRKNFDVMMANICQSMVDGGVFSNIAAAEQTMAAVSVAMTVIYGVGQIVNGMLGDKIKPQTMLTAGLALASLCNVVMYFTGDNYIVMAVIWGVNGFAHSMLWPPIVRLMSMYLTNEEYGYSAVRVSWGSSIATILLYVACSALLTVIRWRTVILICAFGGIAILIVWILLNKKLFSDPLAEVRLATGNEVKEKKKSVPLPVYVFVPIVLIMLGIILQGALRDGVTTWTPSILNQDYGLPEESAIFYTVIPAIFSMISFSLFDLLHRKVFRNEVTCSAVIFGGSAVFALAIYLTNSFVSNEIVGAVTAVLFISLITGCMHGINLMLITVVPKRFIKSGKVSTFSGILNACTYVGSAIATPLFPALKSGEGWGVTMLAWAIISAAGVAVCLIAVPLWKKFRHDYVDTTET